MNQLNPFETHMIQRILKVLPYDKKIWVINLGQSSPTSNWGSNKDLWKNSCQIKTLFYRKIYCHSIYLCLQSLMVYLEHVLVPCICPSRNCLMRNFFITALVPSRPSLAQIDDSTFSFLREVSLGSLWHNGFKGVPSI